jgi:hypothetical protein
MVINKIHLGSVVFARTLTASIAARQPASPASSGCPSVNHGIPHAAAGAALRNCGFFQHNWSGASGTGARGPGVSAAAIRGGSHPIERCDDVVERFHQR